MRTMPFWRAIAQAIYADSTRPIRLLLALVEILFATYLAHEHATPQFDSMLEVMPLEAWLIVFMGHSFLLFRGMTGRFNRFTWLTEGWGGMMMWWIAAITNWSSQGVPGPSLACALAMTIIWINYPGNRVFSPPKEDE